MTLPAQSSAPADHQHRRAMPDSVGSDAIVTGAVGSDELADNAVDTAAIVDGAVTIAKIAAAARDLLSPPGLIAPYGGSSAPTGWLLCDGSAVSRTTYDALFAAIGTAYGTGDGSTTFNLPDLRQRFPLGKAASGTGATLGGTGGAIDHTHALDTASSGAEITISGNNIEINRKTLPSWNSTLRIAGTQLSGNTGMTTGATLEGSSDTANPPFQVVNFIIRTGETS